MALSSEESSESSSDSSSTQNSIVQEYVMEAYELGLDPSMVEYICLRADAGMPVKDQEGKVHGNLPTSATTATIETDNSEEWKAVGCFNTIGKEAVSPDTIDKIRQLASIAAANLPEHSKIMESVNAGGRPFSMAGMKAILELLPPVVKKAGQSLVEALGAQVVTQVLMGGRLDISKSVAQEELSASDIQRSMASFSAEVDPASMADSLEGVVEETNVEKKTTVDGRTTVVSTTTTEHSTNTTTEDSAEKNQKSMAVANSGLSFGMSSSSSQSSSKGSSSKTDSSEVSVSVMGGDVAAVQAASYSGELSQSDLQSWAESVPAAAAVLKK